MRVTNILKENSKGLMSIETETEIKGMFPWSKSKNIKRTFIANKEYPKSYWNWVELPNKNIVPDMLSFQLNKWVEFDV